MLLDRRGLPQPPAGIVERLRAVDANLGIAWIGAPDTGQWAITYEWAPDDPRRRYIQQGEMDPDADFDALAFLPPDCTVDQAYGYVLNGMRSSRKEAIHSLLDKLDRYNADQSKVNWGEAVAPAMEQAHGQALKSVSLTQVPLDSPLVKKTRKKASGDAG